MVDHILKPEAGGEPDAIKQRRPVYAAADKAGGFAHGQDRIPALYAVVSLDDIRVVCLRGRHERLDIVIADGIVAVGKAQILSPGVIDRRVAGGGSAAVFLPDQNEMLFIFYVPAHDLRGPVRRSVVYQDRLKGVFRFLPVDGSEQVLDICLRVVHRNAYRQIHAGSSGPVEIISHTVGLHIRPFLLQIAEIILRQGAFVIQARFQSDLAKGAV